MRKHLTGLFVGLTIACTMAYGASRVLDVLRFRTSTLPATCTDGELRLDTADDGLKKCLSNTWSVIAGSGGGGINYIETTGGENHDAELDTTGWADFADAAATSPVDGTGGSPTTVISRTTSTPLRETGSFLLTKDAADRQGEGTGYVFTLDSADSVNVNEQFISFDYTASANFAFNEGTAADPSDLTVWIYDVTNTALILPLIQSLDGSGHFVSSFTPASDSTSYRLILFIPTTNASAWTFKFDNVKVGPGTILATGPPTTEWIDSTADFTVTSFGTVSSLTIFTRRVGADLQIRGSFAAGTATSVQATLNIPAKWVIDTAQMSTEVDSTPVGNAWRNNNATTYIGANGIVALCWDGSGTNALYWAMGATADLFQKDFGTALAISGDLYGFEARWPVAAFSSGFETGIAFDSTRPAESRASGNPASAAAGAPVIWPTSDFDRHSAYSVSTGLYTCPFSGKWRVAGYVTSANATITINVAIDGATDVAAGITDAAGEGSFSALVECNAGETISIEPSGTLDVASGHMGIFRTDSVSGLGALTDPINLGEVRVDTSAGTGSTDTAIREYTNTITNRGTDITYATSATAGSTWTIARTGIYTLNMHDGGVTAGNFGWSLNSTQLTTSIAVITAADKLTFAINTTASNSHAVSWTGLLRAGDVVRVHAGPAQDDLSVPARAGATVTRIR